MKKVIVLSYKIQYTNLKAKNPEFEKKKLCRNPRLKNK